MPALGVYAVPMILALAGAAMLFSHENLGDEFIRGAREGFATSIRILPSLIMLICATRMFAASGALKLLCGFGAYLLRPFGIPASMLPVIFMRPISGSAATAMINELFAEQGPESVVGRAASVLMGSSDTILYTLSMYFGAVGIRRTRHALPAAFLTLIFCTLFSVWITGIFFGG